MIAYIKGVLKYKGEDGIVVENHGIGYNVMMPGTSIDRLPPSGEEVTVYTYTHVREDAFLLFGFLSMEDVRLFKLLITVNGVGPKGALGMMSALTSNEIYIAIMAGDAKTISKAPGIGAKTASRVILDLKDKIDWMEAAENLLDAGEQEGVPVNVAGSSPAGAEAREALMALGYSQSEAFRAVSAVDITPDMTVEEVLKQSLKHL